MSKSIKNYYIEDKYINNLLNYKYKGGDISIFNVYVINPFCEFIVNYFPKWLAPNVITISGFFLNLTNLIITIYYGGWKGTDYFPAWVCCLVPFLYTTYIILDYTDGKQARRLKASSPLGLLIDHGTDACTTFYVTINMGAIVGLNNIYQYIMVYFAISSTFFLNTWEEYYVGELILPIIHGVSEGTLFIDGTCLVSAIKGVPYYLQKNKWFGIQYNEVLALIVLSGGIIFGIKSIFGVIKKIPQEKIGSALKDTLIYFILFLSLLSIPVLGDSYIAKEYPKFIFLVYGFEFAKILGILQLSHVLQSPFNPYKPVFLIPLLSILIHNIIFYFTGVQLLISIDKVIIGCFVWNILSWAHFVYFCSEEICELCNIHRFVLGKRYPNKKQFGEEDKKKN